MVLKLNNKRKVILHIAFEKTDTTNIQNFMSENRDMLNKQGVLYSVPFGGKNYTKLVIFLR
jgi:hypothetical protein